MLWKFLRGLGHHLEPNEGNILIEFIFFDYWLPLKVTFIMRWPKSEQSIIHAFDIRLLAKLNGNGPSDVFEFSGSPPSAMLLCVFIHNQSLLFAFVLLVLVLMLTLFCSVKPKRNGTTNELFDSNYQDKLWCWWNSLWWFSFENQFSHTNFIIIRHRLQNYYFVFWNAVNKRQMMHTKLNNYLIGNQNSLTSK